jgi:hypothetical protein
MTCSSLTDGNKAPVSYMQHAAANKDDLRKAFTKYKEVYDANINDMILQRVRGQEVDLVELKSSIKEQAESLKGDIKMLHRKPEALGEFVSKVCSNISILFTKIELTICSQKLN